MPSGSKSIGFRPFKTNPAGIIFRMNRDKGGHSKSAFVFFTHFRSRTFGSHHDHRNIFPNLHSFFHNIESVGIGKHRILLNKGKNAVDYICVLFIGGKIDYQVCFGNEFFISTHFEIIFRSIFKGSPFLLNSAFS